LILTKKKPNWVAGAGAFLVGGVTGLVILGVSLKPYQQTQAYIGSERRDPPLQTVTLQAVPVPANNNGDASAGFRVGTMAQSRSRPAETSPARLASVGIEERVQGYAIAPAAPVEAAVVIPREPSPAGARVLAQETAPTPSSAPAPMPSSNTPADAPYVDKLIEPGVAEQPPAEELARPKGLSRYGSGSAGIDYRYYRSRATGDTESTVTENGFGVTFRQATPNFGLIDLQAAVTNQTDDPAPNVGSGNILRLAQTDLPLTGNWFMDNLVGQTLVPAPANVALSYRLRLPAPLISGLATRVSHDGTTLAATSGDLGILRGRTFPVFESTDGSVTGVAATHQFSPHWGGGLQVWGVKDALVGTDIDSHTSFAGAVEYRDPVSKQLGQLHFLTNDGGNNGLWLDGETTRGRWQHNYGVFRLDPDLVWIDNTYAIPNDQQGIYWNGVYQTFRWSVRGGADWVETNLDDDLLLTGRKTSNLFSNVAYRLSPRLNVDGALRWSRQRPGAGLPSENSDTIGARSTVSYRLGNGTSFWTVGVTDFNNDSNPSTVSELIWDYEWRIPQTRLRTGIEYQRNEQSLDTLSETQLRIIASRRFFDSRFGLNAIYTAGVAGGGLTEEGRTSSLSLNLDWRVNRAVELRLDLTQNRNVVELVNGSETRVTERSVFLSVAYQFGWNSARTTFGRGGRAGGQGRIAGTVFLDANRNGIQEPDEAGLANVSVYLDRGFSVTTDARGHFEFWPVPTGDHTVLITLDNVPLPWGLVDESPRQVKVAPRDTVRLDYGLTKINE
jgi:hypothetical protein